MSELIKVIDSHFHQIFVDTVDTHVILQLHHPITKSTPHVHLLTLTCVPQLASATSSLPLVALLRGKIEARAPAAIPVALRLPFERSSYR